MKEKMSKGWAPYILSCIAVTTYMAHFWQEYPACVVLWGITGGFSIGAIYSGIIESIYSPNDGQGGRAIMGAVMGGLVFLGITLSAIFLFVPQYIY